MNTLSTWIHVFIINVIGRGSSFTSFIKRNLYMIMNTYITLSCVIINPKINPCKLCYICFNLHVILVIYTSLYHKVMK